MDFLKLGMCIDIVEPRFGIANGQYVHQFLTVLFPQHDSIMVLLSFHMFSFSWRIQCDVAWLKWSVQAI